jgi:hypothetical protein
VGGTGQQSGGIRPTSRRILRWRLQLNGEEFVVRRSRSRGRSSGHESRHGCAPFYRGCGLGEEAVGEGNGDQWRWTLKSIVFGLGGKR